MRSTHGSHASARDEDRDTCRIVKQQIEVVPNRWGAVCTAARLSVTGRRYFQRRQFLNPFAFEGLPASLQP